MVQIIINILYYCPLILRDNYSRRSSLFNSVCLTHVSFEMFRRIVWGLWFFRQQSGRRGTMLAGVAGSRQSHFLWPSSVIVISHHYSILVLTYCTLFFCNELVMRVFSTRVQVAYLIWLKICVIGLSFWRQKNRAKSSLVWSNNDILGFQWRQIYLKILRYHHNKGHKRVSNGFNKQKRIIEPQERAGCMFITRLH